jgi:hypothetical protein
VTVAIVDRLKAVQVEHKNGELAGGAGGVKVIG